MKNSIKKLLSVLLITVIIMGLFSACNSGSDSSTEKLSASSEATLSPEEIAAKLEEAAKAEEAASLADFKSTFYDNYQNENFDVNNIVLTFAAISDLHIGLHQQTSKVEKGMQFLSRRTLNGLDAVLINGDLTNSYRASKDENQIATVRDVLVNNLPQNTSFFYSLGTSHDADGFNTTTNKSGKEQREAFIRVLGDRFSSADIENEKDLKNGCKHAVINNYHFLSLDNENNDYTTASLKWLQNELKTITAAEPNKTVFVMTHIPASASLNKVLKEFPQVIYFSAHEHIPFNTPVAITQNSYTSLAIGGFAYYREESVNCLSLQDNNNNYEYGQGYLIEVDKNGNTRALRLDFFNETVLKESWVIPSPKSDKSHLEVYSSRKNYEKALFAEDAQISIDVDETNLFAPVKITFPAAKASDGQPATMYNITVEISEGSGTTREETLNISSLYMKYPNGIGMPESYTVTVDGVASPYSYKVVVKAYNCLGRATSTLKGELKSEDYNKILGLKEENAA